MKKEKIRVPTKIFNHESAKINEKAILFELVSKMSKSAVCISLLSQNQNHFKLRPTRQRSASCVWSQRKILNVRASLFEFTRKQAEVQKFFLERIMGVGPTSQAWEARILPMYYIRIFRLFYFCLNIFYCFLI